MGGVIELNVGGVVFSTTESTLCSAGTSFFTSLLGDDFSSKKSTSDSHNRLFIDRDGALFKPILNWLRTGVMEVELPLTLQMVLREAQFFSLSGLVSEIEAALMEQEQVERLRTCPDQIIPIRTDGYYLKGDYEGAPLTYLTFALTKRYVL
jgi:hypothetical protein